MRFVRSFLLALAMAGSLAPQSTPLKFEVASIKQDQADDPRQFHFPEFLPGGRFVADAPLRVIVATAYDLSPFQSPRLSGGPDWIKNRDGVYHVEAKAEAGSLGADLTPAQRIERMRTMLQNLLADRFKLQMLRETKDLPVYALTVGKNGPKLQPARIEAKDCDAVAGQPDKACHVINGGIGRGIHGNAITLRDMLSAAENWSDRPLVDQTGLTGLYNIQTEGWAPMKPRLPRPGEPTREDIEMQDSTRPTLFAIFERLGLKLTPQKAMIETFVIQQVERPTGN